MRLRTRKHSKYIVILDLSIFRYIKISNVSLFIFLNIFKYIFHIPTYYLYRRGAIFEGMIFLSNVIRSKFLIRKLMLSYIEHLSF